MHKKNVHKQGYHLDVLYASHPALKPHIITKQDGNTSIDFRNPSSILELNKALLKVHYGVSNWDVPSGYLCPPIPNRVDYILHLADLVGERNVTGLDIGTGANIIYPILGKALYKWNMVASETDEHSFAFAHALLKQIQMPTSSKNASIKLRQQTDRGSIFKHIIKTNEYYDFTMCNPPFYSSKEEALKANNQKNKGLGSPDTSQRNFSGKSHELWCNGGEALFVKRMIKESVAFASQVKWFTSLVARKEHLPKLEKLLIKLKTDYQIVEMSIGQKKSRFLAWRFQPV